MLKTTLFAAVVFLSLHATSQSANNTLKLDPNKPLRLDYDSKSWNKNPQAVDVSSIILRDAGSGRLARIEMQETGPDTGKFIGNYQIGFRPDSDILPEIYVAPQKMLSSSEQLKKIDSMIKEGLLLRKPFFLRQVSRNLQGISVYDSREQALQAYQDYKVNKPLVDPAALEAFERAAQEREKLKLLAMQSAQEASRLAMEALEKKRIEDLKKQQEAMDAAEKERRIQQAKDLAREAMVLFKKEDFKGAEAKFAKATELDPSNTSYMFPYGVTLYKIEKYNQSLVALNMAQGADVNITERDYFKALNHMKLKEPDPAHKYFTEVKSKNDKALSGTASFFAGVIDFQKERYDPAQKNFEYTLDNSTDPKMDQQAEAYIEQIANIKYFLEQKSKKFLVTLSLGLQYDSNILNVAAANAQTSMAGLRAAYGGTFEYRPVYSQNHEFSGIIGFSDLYSWDTSFKAKNEFQKTDPLSFNLSLPYKYKGLLWDKPFQATITPGYDTTYMNVDESKSGVQNRETIVNSMYVRADNTFIRSEDYFATYSLELRNDQSQIDATDDENQSANKLTLSTAQTVFKNKKKTEAQIYDGALTMNNAKGKNQAFTRIDLGVSYTWPWLTNVTWNGRLGAFYSNYAQHTDSRKDSGLAANIGFQRPFSERWAGTGSLMYTKNNSNLSTNAYDKYILMLGANYNGAF